MKKFSLKILFCIILPHTIFSSNDTHYFDWITSHAHREAQELRNYVLGDRECDPLRKKIYTAVSLATAAIILSLLTVSMRNFFASGVSNIQSNIPPKEPADASDSDYSSAEDDSGDEGYFSADDMLATDESLSLQKKISNYENLYLKQMELLEHAKTTKDHDPIAQFKDITRRQNQAGALYLQAVAEQDAQKKLDLLKQSLKALCGR